MKNTAKVKLGCIGIPVLLTVVGLYAWSRMQWVEAGHVGIIYNAQGGLDSRVLKPQRVFMGYFQTLYTYPTRLQAAIYSQDENYGEQQAADGINITTSDNTQTQYDVVVYYRVRHEDVQTVFRSFGPLPIEQVQTLHIRRFVKEAANAVGARYDVFQLMGSKRKEASELVAQRLRDELKPRGITIEHAFLMNPTPMGDINEKITSRVNAYTQLTTSKIQNQIAELSRQIAIVRADAENKARFVTAAQTKDKSIEMLKLELEEAAVDAWNGKFPTVQVGEKTTVVLDSQGRGAVSIGGSE